MESNICAGRAETSRGGSPKRFSQNERKGDRLIHFPSDNAIVRNESVANNEKDEFANKQQRYLTKTRGKPFRSSHGHRTRRRDAISAGRGQSEGDARNASHIVLPDSLMSFISR
ncbi:hypothetical protein EVAR_98179_1 [Eumeta japonica]|uniref:Uncharacterized protein n=1 Tax=Eumeta variegata TaxID=151549 RepID=A0A4C1YJ01_EUMVA|nr:hypothetical protein EVAR_98179_1 [Eumeta japonica]